jgi:hypothetical protein
MNKRKSRGDTVQTETLKVTYVHITKTSNPLDDVLPYFAVKDCSSNTSWTDWVKKLDQSKKIEVYGPPFYSTRTLALIAWRQQESFDHPFIISRDITKSTSKTSTKIFSFFATPLKYLEWREKVPKFERNDYEVIFSGQKVRFYLEVDFKKESFPLLFEKKEEGEEKLKGFIKVLLQEGNTLLQNTKSVTSSSEDSFQVFMSHDPSNKFSFHIISSKWHTNQTGKVKEWAKDLKNRITELYHGQEYEKYVSAIDIAPYSKAQDFRLSGCCKINTERLKKATLEEDDPNTFLNSVLVIRNEENSSFYSDYHGFLENPQKKVKKRNPKLSQSKPIVLLNSLNEEIIGMDHVLQYLTSELKLKLRCFHNGIWEFTNPRGNGYMCPIHKRCHQNDNPYLYVKEGFYLFSCRRTDGSTERDPFIIIGKVLDNLSEREQEMKRVLPVVFYGKDSTYIPKDTIFLNERYLDASSIQKSFLELDKKCLVHQSD